MEKETSIWGWTQHYTGWVPLILNTPIQDEPEITDLSEAQQVLAKSMSKE
jgi:hypothetical protein